MELLVTHGVGEAVREDEVLTVAVVVVVEGVEVEAKVEVEMAVQMKVQVKVEAEIGAMVLEVGRSKTDTRQVLPITTGSADTTKNWPRQVLATQGKYELCMATCDVTGVH